MVDLISKGGIIIYIIVVLSIVALAIVIERFFLLTMFKKKTQEFVENLKILLKEKDYDGALKLSNEVKVPLAPLVKIAIENRHLPINELKAIIEDNGNRVARILEGRLIALSTIAYVSPLLGLLGTVTGMIRAFMTIQQKAGLVNPGDLAGGIWEALLTTAAGLIVAIPAQIFYSYLSAKMNKYMLNLEIIMDEVLENLGD